MRTAGRERQRQKEHRESSEVERGETRIAGGGGGESLALPCLYKENIGYLGGGKPGEAASVNFEMYGKYL